MAAAQQRNGSFRILFRYLGKQYAFTLGSVARDEAETKASQVDYLLMNQKQAHKLEQELVKAIGETVCRLGLRHLPLLPAHKTMQAMARAAVAVYKAEVDRPKEDVPLAPGE